MVEQQDNVYFYLTLLNENYAQPGLRGTAARKRSSRACTCCRKARRSARRVNLLGSGTILRESIAAQRAARQATGASPPTSGAARASTSSARDGQDAERWNLLHPTERRACRSSPSSSRSTAGPVIASTDYMKNYAEQIRAFLPKGRAYKVLGTDGFGRSDFRTKLREHFEVDRHYIVVAALKALADEGSVPADQGRRGDRQRYKIDADRDQSRSYA